MDKPQSLAEEVLVIGHKDNSQNLPPINVPETLKLEQPTTTCQPVIMAIPENNPQNPLPTYVQPMPFCQPGPMVVPQYNPQNPLPTYVQPMPASQPGLVIVPQNNPLPIYIQPMPASQPVVVIPQNNLQNLPQNPPPIYVPEPPVSGQQMPDRQIDPHLIKATNVHGRDPQKFYCVSCRKDQLSEVNYELGTGSWVCLILACLPCCITQCKDAVHVCPQCGTEVGRAKFLIE